MNEEPFHSLQTRRLTRLLLCLAIAPLAALPGAAGAKTIHFAVMAGEPIYPLFSCDPASGTTSQREVDPPPAFAERRPAAGAFGSRGRSRGSAESRPIFALAADLDDIYWVDELRGLLLGARGENSPAGAVLDLWDFAGSKELQQVRSMTLHGETLIWAVPGAGGEILAASPDGGNARVLVDLSAAFGSDNYQPRSLTASGDRLYWIDRYLDGIYSAAVDGSSPTRLRKAYNQGALAVAGQTAYWVDSSGRIVRGGLTGGEPEPVVEIGDSDWHAWLAIAEGKLYWSSARGIHRANLDGTSAELVCETPREPTAVTMPRSP